MADHEDLECWSTSEVPVKRFKHEEVSHTGPSNSAISVVLAVGNLKADEEETCEEILFEEGNGDFSWSMSGDFHV